MTSFQYQATLAVAGEAAPTLPPVLLNLYFNACTTNLNIVYM